jgi:AcrR family transcriptional regulator
MNTVCVRAGLSQRYFYEHFANRDELLAALFDTLADDLIARTITAVEAAGPDLYDQASAALAVFYDTVMMDPPRARLYAEAVGIAAVADRKRDAVSRYSEFVLQRATDSLGPLDKRTRARVTMAVLVLVGGQADATVALTAGTITMSRTDYIDQHACMLVDAIAAAVRPSRKAKR